MKVLVQALFEKDVSKLKDKKVAKSLSSAILEIENAAVLSELRNVKKIISNGNYYRMRIGSHRLGFKLESGNIILLRFMPRKDIYKYFP